MRRYLVTAAVAAIAAVLVAAPAFAGKGGHNNSASAAGSSISVVSLTASAAGITYGSQVTFNVSTSATTQPWVDAKCFQNGTLVYEQWNGFFTGYLGTQVFTLGPTNMWQGGAANCTADLVNRDNYGYSVLASTTWNVSG